MVIQYKGIMKHMLQWWLGKGKTQPHSKRKPCGRVKERLAVLHSHKTKPQFSTSSNAIGTVADIVNPHCARLALEKAPILLPALSWRAVSGHNLETTWDLKTRDANKSGNLESTSHIPRVKQLREGDVVIRKIDMEMRERKSSVWASKDITGDSPLLCG